MSLLTAAPAHSGPPRSSSAPLPWPVKTYADVSEPRKNGGVSVCIFYFSKSIKINLTITTSVFSSPERHICMQSDS